MERRIGWVEPLVYGLLGSVVINVGIIIGRLEENADERVKEAQIHNAQIQNQLESSDITVGRLVLDDEKDKFRFYPDKNRRCEGKYSVSNDVAKVTGKISCTYSEAL